MLFCFSFLETSYQKVAAETRDRRLLPPGKSKSKEVRLALSDCIASSRIILHLWKSKTKPYFAEGLKWMMEKTYQKKMPVRFGLIFFYLFEEGNVIGSKYSSVKMCCPIFIVFMLCFICTLLNRLVCLLSIFPCVYFCCCLLLLTI